MKNNYQLFRVLVLWQLLLFLIISLEANAQVNVTIYPPVNGNLSVCGSNAINDFSIQLDNLPIGILSTQVGINQSIMPPFPDCVDIPPVPGLNPISIEIVSVSPGINVNFSYDPITSIGNFTFPNGTAHGSIVFRVKLDCSLIPNNASGSLPAIFFNQSWTFNGSPIPNQVSPLPIIFPYFGIPNTMAIPGGGYGQTLTFYFPYKNTGNAPAHINFDFIDLYLQDCSPANQIYALTQPPEFGVGITQNSASFQPYSSGSTAYIPIGNTLYIKYVVKIIQCNTTCLNLQKVQFKWQCYDQSPNFCEQCQQEYITQFYFVPETPKYVIKRNEPQQYNDALYNTTCTGQQKDWEFEIINISDYTTIPEINFQLRNHRYPRSLSIIYENDVTLTSSLLATAGPGYDLIPDHILASNSSRPNVPGMACDPNSDVLENIKFQVLQLAPGGSIKINFKTSKCCPDDGPTFDYLYNSPIYFNHWQIESNGFTACGVSLNPTVTTPASENAILDLASGSINGNGIIGTHDLLQSVMFTPTVNDMTAPEADFPAAYSAPEIIELNMNGYLASNALGMFGTTEDLQTLGYTPTTPDISGILRVKIRCDKGLSVENSLRFEYETAPGTITTWSPIGFTNTATNQWPPENCENYDYVFYFNLSDLSNFTERLLFLRKSDLYFNLIACCDATQPRAFYTISFDILQDASCFTFTPSPPTCTSGCCWIPLKKVENSVSVHCPGCVAPGIIVRKYRMERTTLGFEDLNDDGLIDTSPLPIPYSQGANFNSYTKYSKIYRNRSTHGDILEDRLSAVFYPGNNNDPDLLPDRGYNYHISAPLPNIDDMSCVGIVNTTPMTLNYLQLYRKHPTKYILI